jgi:hypothetical protein
MAKKRTIPEPDIEELTPSEITAALATQPEQEPPAVWAPPEGQIISDERAFRIRHDGVVYEHVSEAPDGRWVYARS